MRRAILLVCLSSLPGMAQGQVGPIYGRPDDLPYSLSTGQLYFRPTYGNGGNRYYGDTSVPGPPRAVAGDHFRTDLHRTYDWNQQARQPATSFNRRSAGFMYHPHYPGLSYSAPPDARPDIYVIPPVTVTPYHDPYFEERIWDDDDYYYWGW